MLTFVSTLICILSTANGIVNYDVNLKGKLKLSPDFMNKIRTGFKSDGGVDVVQFDLKIPEEILKLMGLEDEMGSILRTGGGGGNSEKEDQTPAAVISPEFIRHLTDNGVERIRKSADILQKDLKLHHKQRKMLESKVDVAISGYLSKFKEHIDLLLKEEANSTVDKDLLLMDIITSSNDIYFNESKILLDEIINKNVSQADIDQYKQTVFVEYQRQTGEDFKYLCDNSKLFACRQFPGVFDFSIELLKQLLKSKDDRLKDFGKAFVKIFKSKLSPSETVLGKELVSKIKSNVELFLIGDKSQLRKSLDKIMNFLMQRRKWQASTNKKWSKKRKAMILFMDIIDKVFAIDEEDVVTKHFDGTVIAIQSWAAENRNDIETIIYTLANYIVDTLSRVVKAHDGIIIELKTLVEIIFKGKSKNRNVYKYLLTEGSNFTNKGH